MLDKLHHYLSEHKFEINDLLEGATYGTLGSLFMQTIDKEIIHLFWVVVGSVTGAVTVFFVKKILRILFPEKQKQESN